MTGRNNAPWDDGCPVYASSRPSPFEILPDLEPVPWQPSHLEQIADLFLIAWLTGWTTLTVLVLLPKVLG